MVMFISYRKIITVSNNGSWITLNAEAVNSHDTNSPNVNTYLCEFCLCLGTTGFNTGNCTSNFVGVFGLGRGIQNCPVS